MTLGPKLRIFVLIDALGWQLLEGRKFLCDLLPFRMPLRTVLGYSSGAIPSILSGLPPSQNGHWNLYYFDPVGSPFRWLRHLRFLPDRLLDNRITRKLLKEAGRRLLGLGPAFECCVSPRILPWFNWVEKRDLYAPGGISGAPSIFDSMKQEAIPSCVYTYREWTDKAIFDQARRDLQGGKASFFFLYLSEMDMFLHMHCGNGRKLEERLEWYETELRDLYRLAGHIDSQMSFTILSDHGMTEVKHHVDLLEGVEALGFRMPRDYLAVYDSTMARFWFFDEGVRRIITEHLKTLTCGGVVSSGELQELGVYFPDQRYGQLIFLLHPGWLISRSDFNGYGWSPVGMHGYHPDDPDSDAIFLSNNVPSATLHTISDVFQCLKEAVPSR